MHSPKQERYLLNAYAALDVKTQLALLVGYLLDLNDEIDCVFDELEQTGLSKRTIMKAVDETASARLGA
jgi:hypothetical protein